MQLLQKVFWGEGGVAMHVVFLDPIYLQCVIIHSANGWKGEGWHVQEYSVALLCKYWVRKPCETAGKGSLQTKTYKQELQGLQWARIW
jgi:hypothetical protein